MVFERMLKKSKEVLYDDTNDLFGSERAMFCNNATLATRGYILLHVKQPSAYSRRS